MFERIRYKIKDIDWCIWNLRRWFPIIWEDRDFDYNFLLAIMKFKIQNMKRRAVGYDGAGEVADEMQSVIDLLDYFMGEEGYVGDQFNNRERYDRKKEQLMNGLSGFEAWWD